MDSDLFDEDHELFRASVRGFVDRHVVPNLQKWDADRLIDRETWLAAGKQASWAWPRPTSSAVRENRTTGIGWLSSRRSHGSAPQRCSRASPPTTTSY